MELQANDGMLDVAERRIRLQRGDQNAIMTLLNHLRADHANDEKVLSALAEVLMEAGIDLSAIAGGAGMPSAPTPSGGAAPTSPQQSAGSAASESGGIWTPGGDQPSSGGEKKIWTPDS